MFAEQLVERLQDAVENACTHPGLEVAVAGRARWVTVGKIPPRSARGKNAQDRVKDEANSLARPPFAVRTTRRNRKEGRDDEPVLVGQLHA